MIQKEKSSWIMYMSTFPPRECGIATFTKDLVTAMDKRFNPKIKSKITAMNNNCTNIYNYPENVMFQISDTNIHEYAEVAEKINKTDSIKIVNIQHEFSIFGGRKCRYLIHFIEALNKPFVVTFHTVLPDPDDQIRKVVQSIARKAACLIVMNNLAIDILRNDYGLNNEIIVIPHGIHPVDFNTSVKAKTGLGYKDRVILTTFGMINPHKGIEHVISALPDVIKKFPDVLYLIIGETHPYERKKRGEKYRNFLEKKVKESGLQEHVKFYNKYVKLNEIIKYLEATDIYIAPSLNQKQITSGTISYAMGSGRVVISTPFLHAKDAVTPEMGLLVEFNNPKSFSDAIIKILSDPLLKQEMEKNAYSYTRDATWPNVAESYMNIFKEYL